jgi:hypothetical protein
MKLDKCYTKIVDFTQSYNFVVHTFYIWNCFNTQVIDTIFTSKIVD